MLHTFKNEGVADRFARVLFAEVLILGGYFWLGGTLQTVAYVAGVISLITAYTGFCAFYKIIGVQTVPKESKTVSLRMKIFFVGVVLIVAVVGSYYSAFFTKKFFLNDYNQMNTHYKQVLFSTGQSERDVSIVNYDKLVSTYADFYGKYNVYHPYAIKSDTQFNDDLKVVSETVGALKEVVYSGDLSEAHTSLESIRPIFQDILKRNNFSLLAVTLVDFHDAMEKIIDASDAKDINRLLTVYPEVDEKLKAVELVENDPEIQMIRVKLEEIIALARDGNIDLLASKASELKSAFVKVYLKRG